MNKTILRNVHLVNWYGFNNITIPISENLTLISGENECGKSTILDAIKYAYTGDTQFNKANSVYNTGVGKRNLVSYTRCLVDASAGIYARPADKIPVVYTHIALEYYDQINEKPFVLGVVIETAVTDIRGTHWYAMDDKTIEDISFVYEEGSILKPYDASGFQKINGAQMKTKKDGIALFMQMIGLKLPYHDVAKYQRKLRNIMAYNPAAKIQEFIKESVLEEHNVNFDKLKEAKKNIEQINSSLEKIKQEGQDLDSILADYIEHDEKALQLKIDDIKIKYKDLLECDEKISEAEKFILKGDIAVEDLSKKINDKSQEIENLDKVYLEKRRALLDLDASKAIETSKQLMNTYEKQYDKLNEEKEKLELFQKKIQEMMIYLSEIEVIAQNHNMLGSLTSESHEVADKQRFIDLLKEGIQESRDKLIEKHTLLKNNLEKVKRECAKQNSIIEICNKNMIDDSNVQEQRELIKEINKELKNQGFNETAHMAYEYVSDLTDEKWRDAIEAFLGVHRYAVIVSKDAFDIANAVLDKSKYRYVELVNTKRLMSRKIECEEDSVFNYLSIKNETAANYFKFWLGRIHGVNIEDVPNYDNAMSMEGKLSRNMALTYINTRKIKSYCLGSEAIERNRSEAEKRLQKLKKEEQNILLEQGEIQKKSNNLKECLSYFKEYNLNAHKEWEDVTANLKREKQHYDELVDAQKNNVEWLTLDKQVSQIEKELATKRNESTSFTKEKTILEAKISEKKKSVEEFKVKRTAKQTELDNEKIISNSAFEKAKGEYDQYLSGKNPNGALMSRAAKEKMDRRVRELEGNINGKQQAYNNRKQEVDRLPIGLEYEAHYQNRRKIIWMEDSQEIQQKLTNQTITYEQIFKREFVLNIYNTAKEAKNDISDINKELRKLQFSTKYQFDVKMLNDNSDYAKILRYAKYLEETNNMSDGQMTFDSLRGYESGEVEIREREIRDIINKIIDHNDVAEIKKFADYRNYMSYEIIINNDEVKDGKLSKQVGYNSGAGTQIPYTLILSAALSMLYNARVNSVRLIFIDEPFEKMSDHNIKLMLDFFKNQNFQVIFCAPPNKLESIGSECGVIIPVLKISNDNMQIGEIKFYEQ